MRGDSLQDLYAKVAAVLGLGALALSGAVVDYWPVIGSLPHVASALPRPGVLVARGITAVPAVSQGHSSSHAAFTPASTSPQNTGGARIVLASLHHAFDVRPMSDAIVGVAESPVSFEFVPSVATEVPAEAVSLRTPGMSDAAAADSAMAETPSVARAAAVGDGSADDGFITSTMKKTGTSIVRTGVRTGSSIRDAVRVIGVKVRAVFPG